MRGEGSPETRLETFMRRHAHPDADIPRHFVLVREALERVDRVRSTLVANPDIAAKAKDLGSAAQKFAKALRIASAYEVVEDGRIGREGAGSIWPYLRIAELLGARGFGDDVPGALQLGDAVREARTVDATIGRPLDLLFKVSAIEKQADLAAKVFTKRGSPKNLVAARLRGDLEIVWKSLTSKEPGRSSLSTLDQPRSFFEWFVKFALETTNWSRGRQAEIFAAMISGGRIRSK